MTASATIKAQFPAGISTFTANDGTLYQIGSDGTVTLSSHHLAAANDAGALQIITSGTTAARPIICGIGFQYFDTTLGKPVWRKTATIWCDATGATA
jgi:hypothetical protein